METSLMVYDYPEPECNTITRTMKVIGTFETYVTVEINPNQDAETQYDDIEDQIQAMDKFELLEEADKITIEEYEEI